MAHLCQHCPFGATGQRALSPPAQDLPPPSALPSALGRTRCHISLCSVPGCIRPPALPLPSALFPLSCPPIAIPDRNTENKMERPQAQHPPSSITGFSVRNLLKTSRKKRYCSRMREERDCRAQMRSATFRSGGLLGRRTLLSDMFAGELVASGHVRRR